ncbi:hypothetical protein J1614_010737 [Plenodomus biglobosus]|nr:hypothetical protein J1614_010737 [Plenodomus biglobosus]
MSIEALDSSDLRRFAAAANTAAKLSSPDDDHALRREGINSLTKRLDELSLIATTISLTKANPKPRLDSNAKIYVHKLQTIIERELVDMVNWLSTVANTATYKQNEPDFEDAPVDGHETDGYDDIDSGDESNSVLTPANYPMTECAIDASDDNSNKANSHLGDSEMAATSIHSVGR